MKDKYTSLVFSGGGIKGLCYAGVIKALEDLDVLYLIDKFAGTSMGSLFITMIALGYTGNEIIYETMNVNLKKFINVSIKSFFKQYGFDTGYYFKEWIGLKIKEKTGNENYTFQDLWNDKKKELYIVTTCLNTHSAVYLNYKTHPDMPLVDAIRMSISIPFLFQSVKMDNNYYVDGGLVDNFPLHLFDENALGIQIISPTYTEENPSWEIKNMENFAIHNIWCMMDQISKLYKHSRDQVINIVVKDVGMIDFKISNESKKDLIKLGYDTIKKELKKK